MDDGNELEMSRRGVLAAGATSAAFVAAPGVGQAQPAGAASPAEPPAMADVAFEVNGARRELKLDTRTTLLDALREH
ncbi:MAG TPA: aldehyde dehydrogenase iron-sulfur subunit, partial [Beijerinckiaceae bacterium]